MTRRLLTGSWLRLLLFIAGCLLIGWLGASGTESSRADWYVQLEKPFLNPPDWIFAPVWTALYILMAIAGWRIWGLDPTIGKNLKALFLIQLALNGIWSFLFFGLRSPIIALADIVLLWTCLFVLTGTLRTKDRVSGFLLWPYLFWVTFAVYLNAAIWWLNR